jgi:hypothetical protein
MGTTLPEKISSTKHPLTRIIYAAESVNEDRPMVKAYRRDVTRNGGRSGEHVLTLKGPPNSYILGGGDRVFETDDKGQIIRDITPSRYNVRVKNTDPQGIVHESMDKTHRTPTLQDIEVLRNMGIIK